MFPRNLIVLKNQDRKAFPLNVLSMKSANSTLQQIKWLVFTVSFGGIFFNSFLNIPVICFINMKMQGKKAFFSLIIQVLIILPKLKT